MAKTPVMGTLFRAALQSRTPADPGRKVPSKSNALNQLTQTSDFDDLQFSAADYQLVRYLDQHRGAPFEEWPRALRQQPRVERMRRQGLVKRCYSPERYYLTVEGYRLVHWLKRLEREREPQTA